MTLLLFGGAASGAVQNVPISYTGIFGNRFLDRVLDDGLVHCVLKNFPEEAEIVTLAGKQAWDAHYGLLQHFWIFQYRWGGT